MIDFHTHVLPGIDDGSDNIEMSLAILEESARQGVSYVACTPHFDSTRHRLDDFLEKRAKVYNALKERIDQAENSGEEGRYAKLLPAAAEVYYSPGISRSQAVKSLTMEGTDILFLEMPFDAWRSEYIDDIERLCRHYTVVLVHLERYMEWKNRKFIKKVLEMAEELPLYVQINSNSLVNHSKSKKLVKMFDEGDAHLVGSDCHNMSSRAPNMKAGFDVLKWKLGPEATSELEQMNREFLEDAGVRLG